MGAVVCRAGFIPVQEVDRLPAGKVKGVGMCIGPIFSSTPTTLDWLQYYAGKVLTRVTSGILMLDALLGLTPITFLAVGLCPQGTREGSGFAGLVLLSPSVKSALHECTMRALAV